MNTNPGGIDENSKSDMWHMARYMLELARMRRRSGDHEACRAYVRSAMGYRTSAKRAALP